jgi:methylated-DNA-[protein]-cysteine S-methyltransferase
MMDTKTGTIVAFDTPLGVCAVRWTEAGIASVRLPSAGTASLPRLADTDDVPDSIRSAIDGIVAVMGGDRSICGSLAWMSRASTPSGREVYAATRAIPPGSTVTYGDIAREIGRPRWGTGRRGGTGQQPVPDRRAMPPSGRRERQADGVLRPGRPGDEAAHARARRDSRLRPADACSGKRTG